MVDLEHALGRATRWLNSEPLGASGLDGRVVLVDFWTLTCINWLRTVPHVRGWSRAYRQDGLVVVGVHTPEFTFEQDVDLVEQAMRARDIDYPVAVDNEYAVWNAFDNHYWPALYLFDRQGKLRGEHFGEGSYEEVERGLQRLLGIERALVEPSSTGVEAEADWQHVGTSETYLGSGRGSNFTSAAAAPGRSQQFRVADPLRPNHWGLDGHWTFADEYVRLDQPGGSVTVRFSARDANLVLDAPGDGEISFQVLLDGVAPGRAHGVDTDPRGHGVLREGRMYQLTRARDEVRERVLTITFSAPGARAYVFTFG